MLMKKRNPHSYHKVWKQHFGAIPKDVDGRSYEIHHIDGDHDNNDISNLKLVTIQEHYQLHLQNGDWGACLAMSERMKVSPREKSDLAKKWNAENPEISRSGGVASAKKQIEDGTHLFLRSGWQRDNANERLQNGTHHFLGDKNPVHKSMENGTWSWLTHNPNDTKVSCISCHKEVSLPIFNRNHLTNCRGENPKYYDPSNKVSCLFCRKVTVLPNFKRNHQNWQCKNEFQDK